MFDLIKRVLFCTTSFMALSAYTGKDDVTDDNDNNKPAATLSLQSSNNSSYNSQEIIPQEKPLSRIESLPDELLFHILQFLDHSVDFFNSSQVSTIFRAVSKAPYFHVLPYGDSNKSANVGVVLREAVKKLWDLECPDDLIRRLSRTYGAGDILFNYYKVQKDAENLKEGTPGQPLDSTNPDNHSALLALYLARKSGHKEALEEETSRIKSDLFNFEDSTDSPIVWEDQAKFIRKMHIISLPVKSSTVDKEKYLEHAGAISAKFLKDLNNIHLHTPGMILTYIDHFDAYIARSVKDLNQLRSNAKNKTINLKSITSDQLENGIKNFYSIFGYFWLNAAQRLYQKSEEHKYSVLNYFNKAINFFNQADLEKDNLIHTYIKLMNNYFDYMVDIVKIDDEEKNKVVDYLELLLNLNHKITMIAQKPEIQELYANNNTSNELKHYTLLKKRGAILYEIGCNMPQNSDQDRVNAAHYFRDAATLYEEAININPIIANRLLKEVFDTWFIAGDTMPKNLEWHRYEAAGYYEKAANLNQKFIDSNENASGFYYVTADAWFMAADTMPIKSIEDQAKALSFYERAADLYEKCIAIELSYYTSNVDSVDYKNAAEAWFKAAKNVPENDKVKAISYYKQAVDLYDQAMQAYLKSQESIPLSICSDTAEALSNIIKNIPHDSEEISGYYEKLKSVCDQITKNYPDSAEANRISM